MIVLLKNYALDRQQSMLRFAAMMANGLREARAEVVSVAPVAICGRWVSSIGGLGKWLRYVDKFLLYPRQLSRQLARLNGRASESNSSLVVHICDHSNSLYAPLVKKLGLPLITTCHDLGAVRGALGEDTQCPATATGRVLQNWICKGLGMADIIACVSTATRKDVERLIWTPAARVPRAETVLLGLNVPYGRLPVEKCRLRLSQSCPEVLGRPFILNVGSNLARKNRDGVLRILARLRDDWPGNVVFAGEPLTTELTNLATRLGVRDRVIQAIEPSDQTLEALYNQALALLFPSKFEGFGWPVIEAQACGCPVLCSDAGSLAEVAGPSAFVRPWEAEEDFAHEILRIASEEIERERWINSGLANLRRFEAARMIDQYLRLYREVCDKRPGQFPFQNKSSMPVSAFL